jgi:hypothetical protein
MTRQLSAPVFALACAVMGAWRTALDWCHDIVCDKAQVYRPEAYYMRGPGPRWREKHAQGNNSSV